MSETVEIEISDPYAQMLESLEDRYGPEVYDDLAQILEQNVHESYQAIQS